MTMYLKWTSKEIATIKKWAGIKSALEISLLLPYRSRSGVQKKAADLGISLQRKTTTPKPAIITAKTSTVEVSAIKYKEPHSPSVVVGLLVDSMTPVQRLAFTSAW